LGLLGKCIERPNAKNWMKMKVRYDVSQQFSREAGREGGGGYCRPAGRAV